MHDKLMKMMEKKKKSKMDDVEKEAKMGVLKSLQSQAEEALGEKVKGIKKVSVVSDSVEGLEKGLEKAEDIVKGGLPMSEAHGNIEEGEEAMEAEGLADNQESEEEEGIEEENLSEDEIDAKLAKLMAMKSKMKMKG